MREFFISNEDRAEYESLMQQAWGDNGHTVVTAEAASHMRRLLVEAEQAGRPWASVILDAALASGLQSIGKKWLKNRSLVPVAYDGSLLGSTTTRVGVTHRDAAGSAINEQRLFQFLTWDQLISKQDRVRAQIRAIGISHTAITKLLLLRERFPDSAGPGEALELAGLSVKDYLAADEAAG